MNAMNMSRLPIGRQYRLTFFKFIYDIRIFLVFSFLLFSAFTSAIAAEKQTFEAESAELVGGASKVADSAASGGYLVGLTKPGQGISSPVCRLPANWRFAMRRWKWARSASRSTTSRRAR